MFLLSILRYTCYQGRDIFLNFFSRKYLPILKKFPAKYIFEPWLAPESVQKTAGCIVGEDYPRPIVDHSVISKKNINRMKEARSNQGGGGTTSSTETGDEMLKFPFMRLH